MSLQGGWPVPSGTAHLDWLPAQGPVPGGGQVCGLRTRRLATLAGEEFLLFFLVSIKGVEWILLKSGYGVAQGTRPLWETVSGQRARSSLRRGEGPNVAGSSGQPAAQSLHGENPHVVAADRDPGFSGGIILLGSWTEALRCVCEPCSQLRRCGWDSRVGNLECHPARTLGPQESRVTGNINTVFFFFFLNWTSESLFRPK